MIVYVVYFRTMEDSPEVEIRCVTTNKELADAKFKEAKREEAVWMVDEDEDSGNWAEACIKQAVTTRDIGKGSTLYVGIATEWVEVVSTDVCLFDSEHWARRWVDFRKRGIIAKDGDIEPFDEDETLEESMHLCNPDVMSDYYFSVEPVIVE